MLRAIVRLSEDGGAPEPVASSFEGKRFNSPNDVVLGPDGAIYFTDPTLDLPQGQKQEIPFQGVYRIDARDGVRLLTKDLAQPDGLAFSLTASTSMLTIVSGATYAFTISNPMVPSPMVAFSARSRVERATECRMGSRSTGQDMSS